LNGHSEPRFFEGRPVYARDPIVEADALELTDEEFFAKYPKRKSKEDTFARDPITGALIQETVEHPPNPAIVVKLLASLAPKIYGEKSTLEVNHTGAVWIEGQAPGQGNTVLTAPDIFAGAPAGHAAVERPTNLLALPRPCSTSEEFDSMFLKKFLRVVVL